MDFVDHNGDDTSGQFRRTLTYYTGYQSPTGTFARSRGFARFMYS